MKSLKSFFLLAAMLLVVTSCATQYKSKPTMKGGCKGWNDPSSLNTDSASLVELVKS